MNKNKPPLFYGYKILAAGFFATMLLATLPLAFGVFFKPLSQDFGWSRGEMSLALTISSIVAGVSAFFVGRLTDRYGPRVVLLVNGICAGLANILMSQVYSLWQVYLFQGFILPIGTSGADVPVVSTIARWFTKRRGMMIGIAKVGSGIGIMIVPFFSAWLLGLVGWRTSYIIIGIFSLAVLIPAALVFKRDPAQIGARPDNSMVIESPGPEPPSHSIISNIKQRRFWLFTIVWCSFIYCQNMVNFHLVNHLTDINISPQIAPTVLMVYGGASMFGRVLLSGLSDRIGQRNAYFICHSLFIAAFTIILFGSELWQFYIFGAAYGFAHGGAYALLAPMATWLFGLSSIGSMVGIFIFSGSMSGAVSAVASGYIFDITGNYFIAFVICLLFATCGFISLFWIKKRAE